MATSVRCILCIDQQINNNPGIALIRDEEELLKAIPYDIKSTTLSRSDREEMGLLGQEMVKHIQACHTSELAKIVALNLQWNGFNVMKYFETAFEDDMFTLEKEKIRDELLEELMFAAPEEGDEEFEDEDGTPEGQEVETK